MAERSDDEEQETADPVPEQIGPYQVEGQLGRGGMGEVYRGYDGRLDRAVALKRVLGRATESKSSRRRFQREARTVARLNHSSIVQVYDWVETQEHDWLVMELVEGTPLSELHRTQPLPTARVVEIGIGIADGLAAAHQAGIVHRDLKLSNVMVSENGAKILDFGIAKPMPPAAGLTQTELTREGAVLGSVPAMSPEQALGHPLDHRSDLFSFGSLLYELLTGISPFKGGNALETLLRIQALDQKPACQINVEVPQSLSDLIDRLLEKEPDNRPEGARQVAAELRQIAAEVAGGSGGTVALADTAESIETLEAGTPWIRTPSHGVGTTVAAPPSGPAARAGGQAGGSTRRRWWIAIAIAIAVATAVVAAWTLRETGPTPSPAEPSAAREVVPPADDTRQPRPERIVVLPFENRTGRDDFESFGVIVSDWLTQGLSRGAGLEVVPTDLAVRSARFAAAGSDDGSPLALGLVAEDTGAGTVISGAFYLRDQELILRGQITDARASKVISGLEPLTTRASDPIGLLEPLEQAVRTGVATYLDPQLTTFGNLANSPPTYEAYDSYVRGMERFWRLDFAAAVEQLETAAEMAPSFALPRLMAATAHVNLGQLDDALPIIEGLDRQRETLAPLDRLFLDWLLAESRGDYPWAAEIAGQAASLAPLSGWTQTRGVDSLKANMPRQALEALAPLDPERGYLRGWVPHFEYLTLARHLTGDHEGELRDARYGRSLYPQSIMAVIAEARALAALDQPAKSRQLLAVSRGLRPAFIHTPDTGMNLVAFELWAHGHEEQARQVAEELVELIEARGATEPAPAADRAQQAQALFFLGRHGQAAELYRALAEEDPENIDFRGSLGVLAAAAGDSPAAEHTLEALGQMSRPYLFGRDDYWRAAIHAWRGEQEDAVRLLRQAVDAGHPFVWPSLHPHVDPVWRPLRDYPPFQEVVRGRG